MKRNAVYTALLTIASLLIITAVLFTSLQFCMNQRDWYYKSYVKYNTDKHTMMSNEDMTEAIFRLVDYMEGRVDSIQLSVTEAGRVVEMYNRQEIDHMVDVKSLYQSFRKSQLAAIAAFVTVLLLSLSEGKKGRSSITLRSLAVAVIIFFIILGALGIWAYTDFTAFWTAFHHLFFTNDLWLMDPAVCRMIRICPESLFAGMALSMAAWSAGLILAASLLLAAIEKALAKKHKAK